MSPPEVGPHQLDVSDLENEEEESDSHHWMLPHAESQRPIYLGDSICPSPSQATLKDPQLEVVFLLYCLRAPHAPSQLNPLAWSNPGHPRCLRAAAPALLRLSPWLYPPCRALII